jgi:hypothetical protein
MSSSARVRDSNEPDKAVPFATQAEIVVSDPILYEAGIEPLSRTGQHLLYPDGRSPAGRTISWRGLRGEIVDPANAATRRAPSSIGARAGNPLPAETGPPRDLGWRLLS